MHQSELDVCRLLQQLINMHFPLGVVRTLGSPKVTVACFLVFGLAALWAGYNRAHITAATMPPLVLIGVNLLASMVVHPRLRTDPPLLILHLALLGMLVLIGFARLIYFDGVTTLTVGGEFEKRMSLEHRGPLHGRAYEDIQFTNLGFVERPPAPNKYPKTYNQIAYRDAAGRMLLVEIGDDEPVVINGYRIYATGSWGFSPIFEWRPAGGTSSSGTIQLGNNDPMRLAFAQGFGPEATWQIPGGPEIWLVLLADQWPPATRNGELRDTDLGSFGHRIVVRLGEQRHELRPGDELTLPGGVLRYRALSTWMGYRLVYDPTMPWIISTLSLGVLSIIWFYLRTLWNRGARK